MDSPVLRPPQPLLPSSNPPVGGRLALHHLRWTALFPRAPWTVQTVTEGARITFHSPPPLSPDPRWIRVPKDPVKAAALRQEVQSLLAKRAIEVVKNTTMPAFYAHLFVVPKPGGKWRPVIDLSVLNSYITAPYFRMETARTLRHSVLPGEYAVSIDMSDAYLHVMMHPSAKKFLRFAIDDTVYCFRVLPFGLCTSPWIFTRIVDTVVESVRQETSAVISNYLDDILQKHRDPVVLKQDLQVLTVRLQELGFLINVGKSDLTPSQDFIHLGMHFQTALGIVKLPHKRLVKLMEAVQLLLDATGTTPREISQVIGLCAAAAELIPLGRLHVRPLQWALADLWKPAYGDWETPLTVTDDLRNALRPWLRQEWLLSGVPLASVTPSLSLCTDASMRAWGAHLLPQFLMCSGQWTPQEQSLHINELEMLAVLNAVKVWVETLRNQAVMVLSDNTTVVSYIRNQGGTHSRLLCAMTVDLLQFCHAASIQLRVRHIPGHLNVLADSLSRNQSVHPTEWTLHSEVFSRIHSLFPSMEIDLFATRLNTRLPDFVSPVPDPRAKTVDALTMDWSGHDLYAFPPFPLIAKVVQRLELFNCMMTLIAPLRWNRSWISTVLQRMTQLPRRLPLRPDLLSQPSSGLQHQNLQELDLHMFRLSGGPLRTEASLIKQWTALLKTGAPLL